MDAGKCAAVRYARRGGATGGTLARLRCFVSHTFLPCSALSSFCPSLRFDGHTHCYRSPSVPWLCGFVVSWNVLYPACSLGSRFISPVRSSFCALRFAICSRVTFLAVHISCSAMCSSVLSCSCLLLHCSASPPITHATYPTYTYDVPSAICAPCAKYHNDPCRLMSNSTAK